VIVFSIAKSSGFEEIVNAFSLHLIEF